MTKARINVDELSFVSLFLQTRCNGLLLAKAATGFVVSRGDKSYLITNWHVLAGRHPRTNQPLSKTAALPDELLIAYHRTVIENGQTLTGWCKVSEPLQDFEGKHRWLEHPTGKNVDVVAFPVAANDQVTLHPLSLALAKTNLFAGVGEPVSIIGFPYGLSGGGLFPIWKTGHIASEPEVDYGDAPVFLVDATTRSGMSGAPVIRRFSGFGYRNRSGFEMVGSSTISAGRSELTRFMGVYGGRTGRRSAQIGRVWKPIVIDQILDAIAPK